MRQSLMIINNLIREYKKIPTVDLNDFDQGINEGLILARRSILNAMLNKTVIEDEDDDMDYSENE